MFDIETMKHTLIELEIDVKKMPLGAVLLDVVFPSIHHVDSLKFYIGKLTKRNIQNGYQVLNDIQTVLDSNDTDKEAKLLDLTNKFFTIIPQDFGDERPKPIGAFKLHSWSLVFLGSLNSFHQITLKLSRKRSTCLRRYRTSKLPLHYCRETQLDQRWMKVTRS